ncbi:MAG: tyrosine-type recombinase/integrase, partial [Bdellovibrio sp.]|nr:tyrosine-type recombinase/integrase [Bdellovibrio sp.]
MKTIKRKNGSVYREKIYVEGKQIAKIFKRKSDAIAWKAKMLSLRNAEGLKLKHLQDVPFDAFAQRWLKEKVLTYRAASTYENYDSYLRRHFLPHFGGMSLNKIQSQHIDRFVISLREKGHNTKGINLILGCLRTLLNAAVDEEYLTTNPMRRVKNLKEDLREEIFMTKLEIADFLRVNGQDPLYPLYIVALNSGMRRGELCGLRWDRINFPHSQIEIGGIRDKRGHRATTKSGKRRVVPMNDQVRSLLKDLFLKRKSDYVFVDELGRPVDPHHLYRD